MGDVLVHRHQAVHGANSGDRLGDSRDRESACGRGATGCNSSAARLHLQGHKARTGNQCGAHFCWMCVDLSN
eukprot:708137-Prorocentrum_minimum.AAC.1